MRFVWIILLSFSLVSFVNCGRVEQQEKNSYKEGAFMSEQKIKSAQDVYQFFPHTLQEVSDFARKAIARAQKALSMVTDRDPAQRTFENTAQAFDALSSDFSQTLNGISMLEMVMPDDAIRNACNAQSAELQKFAVDAFSNKKIYKAFKDYVEGNAQKETLNDEQRYFLTEVMRDFKREGLDLPDDELAQIQAIKKELADLTLAFDTNIATDKSSITATRDQLKGLDEHFIASLKQDDHGNYILICNYPTHSEIMNHCSVEDTRKRFYFCFANRAYPKNKEILEKIIAKRDQLAQKLGFDSYAALDIDGKMAQNPERAEKFIVDLLMRAKGKESAEFVAWKKDLPEGVQLDEQGRFNAWDLAFVKTYYKKKHFNIDERKIAEYFEVDKTLQGVFDIYQRFLSLKFTMIKPMWSWHDDVQLIEVREQQSNVLRGYIFIDLYPRENKYSHACHGGIVAATYIKNADGSIVRLPSMALVIANFPKATKDRPALLKHGDVETFFHEFGHAMHYILGSTQLASFSGTSVKLDFVEMPSQIFEEWMFDKALLKSLTHHFVTHEPLPDALIDSLIALKQFDSGGFVTGQCRYALLSLDCFKKGEVKDTDALSLALYEKYSSGHVRFEPDAHSQAAFGHLSGYGAKYYSYMWSKVFALDLFYKVKEQGLVSPAAGKLFIDTILSKGGSIDPNILLKNYLGREPQQDAFFKDLGMNGKE